MTKKHQNGEASLERTKESEGTTALGLVVTPSKLGTSRRLVGGGRTSEACGS